MKMDDKVAKANAASMRIMKDAVKSAGLRPKDLSDTFEVDESEIKTWFSDTMPYGAFLQLCKMTHVKASDVFTETKAVLKAEITAQSDTSKHDQKESEDRESTDEPSVVETIPETDNSHTEDASPVVEAVNDDLKVNEQDGELPFPLITAEEAGLKNADALILEWLSVKKEAIDLRDDLSDEQKAKKIEKYPKPVKLSSDTVQLVFPNYKAAQGFVNGGYLNNINDIVARHHYGVTVSVKERD
jgi:hypothetical protein